RREVPPRSKGDLLAYSVSSLDLMYLHRLRVPERSFSAANALVLTDKQFVTGKDDYLRGRFGATNILVIGSPAVNLLARKINQYSPFHFDISEEAQAELAEQERFIDQIEDDEEDLFIYHQCLEGITDVDAVVKT